MEGTNSDTTEKSSVEPKHNKSGRAALALAFSWVGAKLGLLGMVADASHLLKGQPKNIRSMKNALGQQLQKEFDAGNGPIKSQLKIFKYTLITTYAGMAVGALLGWIRGNRVESSKEVFHHPFRSLKIMFSTPQEEPVRTSKSSQPAPDSTTGNHTDKQHSSANNQSWAQRTNAGQEADTNDKYAAR